MLEASQQTRKPLHVERKKSVDRTKKSDNSTTRDENEIADMFSNNLAEIFKPETQAFVYEDNLELPIPITNPDRILSDEFLSSLKTLNSKAAPGIDKISNKVFKNCPDTFFSSSFNLFNASIKFGYIPTKWKISKIIMIPKKYKPPDNVSSYRPISLITCISKWLKKIVNMKLTSWLESKKFIPPCQCGFRKKMSTHDHFLRLYHSIINRFNNQEKNAAVFFDLEKAFDKVNPLAILTKLKKLNAPPTLYNWIINFLRNRKFLVSYGKANSREQVIKAGVPQGSSLSPTLFSLFSSDIVEYIPKEIQKALFADDLTIWYSNKNLKNIQSVLQTAISAIEKYCLLWGLKLNVSVVFTIQSSLQKLSFKNHFESMSAKIIGKTNLIRKIRSLKIKNKTSLSLLVYKSFIRSQLDFMFIAINNSAQKVLPDVQKLQNRILRSIKFFPIKTRIVDIRKNMKIELLEKRYNKLFKNFFFSRLTHSQIQEDIRNYSQNNQRKLYTPFDFFLKIAPIK